ncbi:glycosyltransferase [Ligilactobacillus ruminis]|uniref:glycosyltransferase n=1 Tax=Ligilactobacillus ruminis TaxID=1623 RepID=UPI002360D2CB|nr:glycosyltransferase [Ligilactobacillus ruminis]WDC80490.1 glycosyltransferase [Ligilactobacillus ruminis]
MISLETWVEELPKKKFFSRVNTTECLVTISMLVSNRIDTVEKCFESFRPLLEQIPSEFIAVDTVGDEKSDGSVDVARKYADKIVHFEWCDDFAAARNSGLKEARGKWLIYLDDDEWFDDAGPLIDFFSKPELYENYDRISMMEHSYTSASQIDYVSSKFSRISAIVPGAEFVDPVHEMLKGIVYRNEYDLKETFVHHVGYIGKLIHKKAKRNQQIMNKELEKNPGNLHLWLQQIAGAGDDEKEMLKFSEKAISTLKSRELDDWNITDWIEIFLYRMRGYARLKMWSDLDVNVDVFLEHVKNPFFRGVAAKFELSRDLNEIGIEKASKWIHIYFDAVEYCEKNNRNSKEISYFFGYDISKDTMYDAVKMYFNLCSKESQDAYEEIKKMILDVPWHIFDEKRSNVLASSLKYAINEEDNATVEFLSENFVTDGILSDEFVKQLDRIDIGIESDTAQEKFDQMIEMIDAKSDSLWIKQHSRKKVSEDELERSLSTETTFAYPNEDLVRICIRNGISPQKYVEKVSFEDVEKSVSAIVSKEEKHLDRIPLFASEIEKKWKNSVQRNYLLAALRKRYIFQGTMPLNKVLEESEKYCRNMIEYAKSIYLTELCDSAAVLLPKEIRFAILFEKALKLKKSGVLKECLAYLQQSLDIFNEAGTLIRRIIQEIELDQRKQAKVNDEMIKLGNQVKSQIVVLISQGQNDVAAGLLNELKQITPEDPDLATLEKLCQS